jgi:hypothetical protein
MVNRCVDLRICLLQAFGFRRLGRLWGLAKRVMARIAKDWRVAALFGLFACPMPLGELIATIAICYGGYRVVRKALFQLQAKHAIPSSATIRQGK